MMASRQGTNKVVLNLKSEILFFGGVLLTFISRMHGSLLFNTLPGFVSSDCISRCLKKNKKLILVGIVLAVLQRNTMNDHPKCLIRA